MCHFNKQIPGNLFMRYQFHYFFYYIIRILRHIIDLAYKPTQVSVSAAIVPSAFFILTDPQYLRKTNFMIG